MEPRPLTQLALVAIAPAPAPYLPVAVAAVVRAAQAIASQARVGRGAWGVGIGPKRRWMLTGDCCCALGALLVVTEAGADAGESSAVPAAARVLGCSPADVYEFLRGYDKGDTDTQWARYGELAAAEIGLA